MRKSASSGCPDSRSRAGRMVRARPRDQHGGHEPDPESTHDDPADDRPDRRVRPGPTHRRTAGPARVRLQPLRVRAGRAGVRADRDEPVAGPRPRDPGRRRAAADPGGDGRPRVRPARAGPAAHDAGPARGDAGVHLRPGGRRLLAAFADAAARPAVVARRPLVPARAGDRDDRLRGDGGLVGGRCRRAHLLVLADVHPLRPGRQHHAGRAHRLRRGPRPGDRAQPGAGRGRAADAAAGGAVRGGLPRVPGVGAAEQQRRAPAAGRPRRDRPRRRPGGGGRVAAPARARHPRRAAAAAGPADDGPRSRPPPARARPGAGRRDPRRGAASRPARPSTSCARSPAASRRRCWSTAGCGSRSTSCWSAAWCRSSRTSSLPDRAAAARRDRRLLRGGRGAHQRRQAQRGRPGAGRGPRGCRTDRPTGRGRPDRGRRRRGRAPVEGPRPGRSPAAASPAWTARST